VATGLLPAGIPVGRQLRVDRLYEPQLIAGRL
jgi:hypothetical protein